MDFCAEETAKITIKIRLSKWFITMIGFINSIQIVLHFTNQFHRSSLSSVLVPFKKFETYFAREEFDSEIELRLYGVQTGAPTNKRIALI